MPSGFAFSLALDPLRSLRKLLGILFKLVFNLETIGLITKFCHSSSCLFSPAGALNSPQISF